MQVSGHEQKRAKSNWNGSIRNQDLSFWDRVFQYQRAERPKGIWKKIEM